jgi:excisionase family DNA binding protein
MWIANGHGAKKIILWLCAPYADKYLTTRILLFYTIYVSLGVDMELLTPQEAATLLKVHINTIYNWIEAGTIRATKIGDVWRIDKDDLERLIKGNGSCKE